MGVEEGVDREVGGGGVGGGGGLNANLAELPNLTGAQLAQTENHWDRPDVAAYACNPGSRETKEMKEGREREREDEKKNGLLVWLVDYRISERQA